MCVWKGEVGVGGGGPRQQSRHKELGHENVEFVTCDTLEDFYVLILVQNYCPGSRSLGRD